MKASDCSLNPSNHCPTQLVSHVIQRIVLLLHLLALHPVDDDVGLVVSSATLSDHCIHLHQFSIFTVLVYQPLCLFVDMSEVFKS